MSVDDARSIGIRELRAGLAATVRRAGAGDRVVVTVDGRAVAQLGPIETSGAPSLADLVAAGLIAAPLRPDRPSPPPATVLPVDIRLTHVLAEIRGGSGR